MLLLVAVILFFVLRSVLLPPLPLAVVDDTSSGLESASESAVVDVSVSSDGASKPLESVAGPEFDVARISTDGYLIVAGRGEAGAVIELLANGDLLADVTVSSDGEWVYMTVEPLEDGDYRIDIQQRFGNELQVGNDSLFLTKIPRTFSHGALVGDAGTDYLVLFADNTGKPSRLLKHPQAQGETVFLSLDIVDYDSLGRVIFQGTTLAENFVSLYLNNEFIAHQQSDSTGHWKIMPQTALPPGEYVVRIDLIDSPDSGKVLHRIELPFFQADLAAEDELDKENSYRIVVQPGNSLWRIARRNLGKGILYTIIYNQNRDRIRDPDLIYPGQIFHFSG